MIRESLSSRLMRAYGRWRLAFFAFLTVSAFGVFILGEYYRIENRDGVSASNHETVEISSWLPRLFKFRGGTADELGVEIVGFDQSMKASDYEGMLKDNEPLRLIAEARNVSYDRAVFAAVLDRLVAAGAKQVVFDFVFEGPGISKSGDKALAEAILRHRDKVVIGFDYKFVKRESDSGVTEKLVFRTEPFEDLLPDDKPDEVLGFVTVWPDFSGGISTMTSREDLITLSKPALASGWNRFEDLSLTARAVVKAGGRVEEDNATRIINFAGPAETFRKTPVQDLFTPDRWRGALRNGARFKDKFVIVGPYSELHYKDSFSTPMGRMLGVEIQANCLHNQWVRSWINRPVQGFSVVFLAGGLMAFVFVLNALVRTRRLGLRMALVFGVPVVYVVVAYLVFSRSAVFLPIMPAVYCCGLAIGYLLFDFIHAQYEKSRITGMFGTYLSPAIVRRMVASGEEPKLGGEQVSLTAFFSDVQSFSSFSEILTPEQLVEIMNEYLGAMTEILEEDAGTLDKYIGDAIVAMFGAPIRLQDHAHRACACALRMQKRLGELRGRWASQGDRWPKKIHAMRMRIGLNTGSATVGNMGSAKRFNYTMMGDTVNLAARCESGAKSAGVYTLVSGETAEAARKAPGDEILFRKIDLWRVKGRSTAVTMYEVVDFMDAASAETKECVRLYEAALELYFGRKFAEALELFEKARALEPLQPGRDPGVEHTPSEIMAVRCAEMLAAPPPADWDGVYVMKSK